MAFGEGPNLRINFYTRSLTWRGSSSTSARFFLPTIILNGGAGKRRKNIDSGGWKNGERVKGGGLEGGRLRQRDAESCWIEEGQSGRAQAKVTAKK